MLFGPTWPSSTKDDPAITVLVYGNPMTTATKHSSDVGSVFLDIPPNRQTREIPTNGLNLLDVSDFYDVAQDLYGCFNREAPTCPPRDNTVVWIVCLAMTLIVIVHHQVEQHKKQLSDGCVLESAAVNEIRKEDLKAKGHHDTLRIIAMCFLLAVPLIIFSPIILVMYLVNPRPTLYKLWHIIAGKSKNE